MLIRVRDWWDSKTLREQRLAMLLGVVTAMVLLGWVAFRIHNGLAELEGRNARRRELLAMLEDRRDELLEMRARGGGPAFPPAGKAEPLPTYLESIETKVGDIKIDNITQEKETRKGDFLERSVHVTLADVTLDQLARFLEQVESDSPVVATVEIKVTRSRSDPARISLADITVATYERFSASR